MQMMALPPMAGAGGGHGTRSRFPLCDRGWPAACGAAGCELLSAAGAAAAERADNARTSGDAAQWNPTKKLVEPKASPAPLQEDVDMSSGSSGNEGTENCSTGRGSRGSNCEGHSKELGEPPTHRQGPDAFSLMMAKSEHHPSTSGCSEQSARADTHEELIKTLKELKVHLPADKKAKGKASTLATLKYALQSVKQVRANEEYYQLLMASESHPCSASVPSYTIEDIESVTSEFVVKNADMFAVAVSLVTGKVLYISDQVASIFHCKRDAFLNAKLVEFLAPGDVSVFHSSTMPDKLPPWSDRSGPDSFTQECMEEKSFFCRVSAGNNHENEIRYLPFRMTPYLVRVREPQGAESQLCCMLLAERVHSGYEAPRIPAEKRIFTTTHSPNCLFQDVDERAVPLLGYLPQDLIESPLLVHLHPSDRPLMLTIHKKIVQSGGQPFDYSPIRFCAWNGEYVTLDTSWSGFVNPWSRKISFIIGRHRVRVGPLNEDVFSALPHVEEKSAHPDIQELTEQIHRLLLQPVPHSGSSGYGSLGSNGSHEHLMSQASSSDSNGHEDPCRRRAGICKNGNKVKSRSHHPDEAGEQKGRSASESSPAPMQAVPLMEKDSLGTSLPEASVPEELACKNQPVGSYQQISCLDSVIRYLESCSEATTLKRKCEFPANTPAPQASDKRRAGPGLRLAETASPSKANSCADVSTHLTSLVPRGKAESVASLPSQCSYSSTIVHVGDKKPQPELETAEDAASGPESPGCLAGPPLPCSLGLEKEPFRRLGLTKEVLAAHTQKEEQSFLLKFKERKKLSVFQSRCHYYLQERSKGQSSERTAPGLRNTSGIDSSWKKTGKNRKLKCRRAKPRASAESPGSGGPRPHRPPLAGLGAAAWSPSGASPPSGPAVPFPLPGPAYSLRVFPPPGIAPAPGAAAAAPGAPHAAVTAPAVPVGTQRTCAVQPPASAAPLAPVMALVLPGCSCPSVTPNLPQAFFPGRPESSGQTSLPKQPCACPQSGAGPPASRAAAPASPPLAAEPTGRASPPLFQSRGSSPLQLNLLQLEEAPEGSAAAGASGTTVAGPGCKPATSRDQWPEAPPTHGEPANTQNSDALSASSGLLDLLLHGDLCSATGSALSGSGASATSDSLGSSSLGCDAPRGGTGSDTSHTSRYLGSIDSSENNNEASVQADLGDSGHFLKYVLQDPIWLLMAHMDDSVMMTYQVPSRDLEAVLKEDREKLRLLRKFQPRFTEGQRRELQEAHPWGQPCGLPAVLHAAECVYCDSQGQVGTCMPREEDMPPLGFTEAADTREEERPPLSHRKEQQA
ncbi:period circadian protein homolog 2 [Manis pentadactyla]|uniref:period circadian protein homolog 2 n=1 Tax=Manis pentadactyla TaxID=143292 RepID=UPI00255CB9C4|nr:period circadian protein homolog 2 [Manis pentadactyla]